MSIILERITKRYGVHLVVDKVSLEVADGELLVLLGASGSGKSTILRMIAGLTRVDSGRVLLHGRDVTALAPQQRGSGFVFQNYSIFRHMSVSENIEFGLKIRKVASEKRAQRREQLLDLVGLAGLGNRYANQLSGGQQQRVALARALAYEPNVLLLDEPFGALDVKIRAQLRRSLREIQQQLRVTTILVTHDQEEAFELADRIGVIERGRLLEVGGPEQLYARPQSLSVATFLGAGTVLVGRAESGKARFGDISLPIPEEVAHEEGARVQVLFRPEQVGLSAEQPQDQSPVIGRGKIIDQTFAGGLRRVRVRVPRLAATRQISPPTPFGEEGLLVDSVLPADTPLTNGELWVSLQAWHILQQPAPRLLACDGGAGPAYSLEIMRSLAKQLRAETTILGVADDSEAADQLRESLKRRQMEADLAEAEVRVRYGNAAEQIISEQAEALYEFLILTAGDQTGSQKGKLKGRLSETVRKVIERSYAPVLVVKSERASFDRVLICTAAGEPGKSDVRVGGRLAQRVGAKVTLLYINRKGETDELTRNHLERAAATLRALDVACETRVRSATSPAEGILSEGHAGDYDLVVVGGHGPESRSIFGLNDVTLQVLMRADRPVLVVPAEEL